MIADYFTKPLQGGLFKKLRNYVMGSTALPIEERVGEDEDFKNKRLPIDKAVKIRAVKKSYANVVRGKISNHVKGSTKANEMNISQSKLRMTREGEKYFKRSDSKSN